MSVYVIFSYINYSKSLDIRVLDAEFLDLTENSWKEMLGREKRSPQMVIFSFWFLEVVVFVFVFAFPVLEIGAFWVSTLLPSYV